MLRKVCPGCKKRCFSLARKGAWFCPTCGMDLRDEPLYYPDQSIAGLIPFVIEKEDLARLN